MSETAFGKYETEELLASGASTSVWRARGPRGVVALKAANTDASRDALQRERIALERLSHAGIPRVLDHDPNGRWIAIEWVNGMQVDQWSMDKTPAEVARLSMRLCHIVEHLHGRWVVHGDIKPQNVLVRNNEPVLLDFGVATVDGEGPKGFRGTPGYVSPEVVRGEQPTKAADIYGIGSVLYEMLTGRPPFHAADPAALTLMAATTLPLPPSSFRTDTPQVLSQLTLALLTRDPARRPIELDKVRGVLSSALQSPVVPPVVGMEEERDALARAVVAAADGAFRLAIVYGPPGSGRQTLLQEALDSARREGLALVKEAPAIDMAGVALRSKRPFVLRFGWTAAGSADAITRLLDRGSGGLCLVLSDRPLAALGASDSIVRITPAPLTASDAVRLLSSSVPIDAIDAIWRNAYGHPGAMLARARRIKREQGADPADLDAKIAPSTRRVLQGLRRHGGASIPKLSELIGMMEHEVVEHVDLLAAEGLVVVAEDGMSVSLTALSRHAEDVG